MLNQLDHKVTFIQEEKLTQTKKLIKTSFQFTM